MDISFNTHNAQATVAGKAIQLYKSKQYNEAISAFTDILDCEPGNWDARLLLGACYFKAKQYITAQRIFSYISNSCLNRDIVSKALEAIRAIDLEKNAKCYEIPPEFGCYAPPGSARTYNSSWMDLK